METRLPPQHLQAEQSILGGIMLDPEAWDQVSDTIVEEDFYKPAHKKIFSAIKELNKISQPTDLVTVSNFLMNSQDLDLIGGPQYLAEIIDLTPTAANIEAYAKIVKDKSLLRRLISETGKLSEKAYKEDFENVESFLDEVEASVFAIAEKKNLSGLVSANDIVKSSMDKIQFLYAQGGDVTGVPSGFADFDRMTAGFQSGEMTIIGARPSMGKTAFSLNVTMHAALNEKKKVAYFSVEMSKELMMMRMLAQEAKVDLGQIKNGQLDNQAWPRLIHAASRISEADIFIDDTSGISPFEIRSKARKLKAKKGLDIIFVDYLQLMSLKQKVDSREREVAEISKMLKAIAKELECPVIALAQLNRSVTGRTDHKPMISDLRESGSIEQDADVIAMLHREEYYDRENPDIKGQAQLIIGKNRNGETGICNMRWLAQYGKFMDNIEGQRGPEPPMPDYSNSPSHGSNNGPGAPNAQTPPDGPPKNFAPSF